MTKNIGVADVLDHGLGLIEEHGWIQNDFWIPGGGYCALGACDAAIEHLTGVIGAHDSPDAAWDLYHQLRRDIRPLLNSHCSRLLDDEGWDTDAVVGVTGWNNVPDRTQGEVLDMLGALATAVRDG